MRKIKEGKRVVVSDRGTVYIRPSGMVFLMRHHLSRDMKERRVRATEIFRRKGFWEAEGGSAKVLRQECVCHCPGTAEANWPGRKWTNTKLLKMVQKGTRSRVMYAMKRTRIFLWMTQEATEIFSFQAQWKRRGQVRIKF